MRSDFEGVLLCNLGEGQRKRSFTSAAAAGRAKRGGIQLRAYLCDCGYFHLTKMSLQEFNASRQTSVDVDTGGYTAPKDVVLKFCAPLLRVGYTYKDGCILSPEGIKLGRIGLDTTGQPTANANILRAIKHWS